MEDDASVIYGLEFQARALTAQTAETDAIRFLVGTQSLKFDNQIHIIDFDDENNVINKTVLLHQAGEIWHISASPADKAVVTTCYNKTCEGRVVSRAAVWRMPCDFDSAGGGVGGGGGGAETPDDSAHNPQSLELLCHLDDGGHGNAACVLWEPLGDGSRAISLVDGRALLFDLTESSTRANVSASATLEGKGQLRFTAGRWSPHHSCGQLATANDTAVRGWDLRSMSQIYCIDNAHGQLVRDLDFNPNRQYYLATCGDDCKVRFWDVRNVQEPVKTLEDHSHWVWSVRYNHSHDQLLLTASSDGRLVLSNMASISSEPLGHPADDGELSDGEEAGEPLADGVVSALEEHEDSVYAAEWSAADPWLFASLSHDGRLVVSRVPRALKYRILL